MGLRMGKDRYSVCLQVVLRSTPLLLLQIEQRPDVLQHHLID